MRDANTNDLSGIHTLVRRFFVKSGDALVVTPSAEPYDVAALGLGVTTFTVNSGPGDVAIGDGRGGGDTANAKNVALTANTKYYIYVTDYTTRVRWFGESWFMMSQGVAMASGPYLLCVDCTDSRVIRPFPVRRRRA